MLHQGGGGYGAGPVWQVLYVFWRFELLHHSPHFDNSPPPHNVSLTPLKEVRSKCQNGGSDAALKGVSDTLEGVGCCDKFLTMNCSILTVSVKNGRSVVPDKNARTFLSY